VISRSTATRTGIMAPVWAVALAILFYGAQLGPEVLDESIHLSDHATRHPTSAHFEDPGKQSHSDHCLLSQARGEFRALPAVFAGPAASAAAISQPVTPRGDRAFLLNSSTCQARAPPVVAA
jgi:hypothetical protein